MEIIVLNLDSSTERMETMNKQFNNLSLPYTRFSAVNGKALSVEELEKFSSVFCNKALCNRGMIGCAISHMQIIRNFVANPNLDFICVMEDDITLSPDLPTFLNDIPEIYNQLQFDVISLFCLGLCNQGNVKIKNYSFTLPLFPLSFTCYILSKKGAKKFLQNIGDKIHYHIDFQLAISSLGKDFQYYVLTDPKLISLTDQESTMGSKSKSLLLSSLNALNLKKAAWFLNVPVLTINLHYTISLYFCVLILLLLFAIIKKCTLIIVLVSIELALLLFY